VKLTTRDGVDSAWTALYSLGSLFVSSVSVTQLTTVIATTGKYCTVRTQQYAVVVATGGEYYFAG
jgi:hypothetical protein